MKLLRLFLILIVVMASVFAVGMYGYYKGWHIDKYETAVLAERLAPDYEVFLPAGTSPFPTVVGFHGCSGLLEGNRDWARFLRELGYAVVLVDSISFRGLDWPEVCSGKTLWGSERAGDAIAALHDIRKLEFVDVRKIILMGWSHGGWTLIDLFALLSSGARPTNLSHVPDGTLDGVIGSVLFYPFCAFPAVGRAGWTHDFPTYFIFAENDTVVPNEACLTVIEKLQSADRPATQYTYKGIDHGFDMRTSDFYENTLKNVPEATMDARKRVADYLHALL